MKINIHKLDVNATGEFLRREFFIHTEGEYGLVRTWNLNSDVKILSEEDKPVENNEYREGEFYHEIVGEKFIDEQKVICRFYWDEDWFISFMLPDGTEIYSCNGKKNHVWQRRKFAL